MITFIEKTEELKHLLKQNKFVILNFYADWCGPCKIFHEVLKNFDKENKTIKLIKVNAEKFPDLISEWKIQSVPATFLIKEEEIKNSFKGYKDLEYLKSTVETYLK